MLNGAMHVPEGAREVGSTFTYGVYELLQIPKLLGCFLGAFFDFWRAKVIETHGRQAMWGPASHFQADSINVRLGCRIAPTKLSARPPGGRGSSTSLVT